MPFRSIEDPTILRRVLEATLLIEANLELPEVLRHLVEEACSMTGARYGALGVLDEDKHALSDFVTVGLSAEEERAIGPHPTGRGVLGLLIADPKPLRLRDIGSHPESFGFPPNHPPMRSFLGVPLKVRDEVYGNLYLTDKVGWSEFTKEDEVVVGALSAAAAIAIENARLHDRVRRSAVYEDRDRVARDLHDTVIQRLFALGLTLQGIAARLPAAASQLGGAVAELDQVIAQVRSTIYELGMGEESRGVRDDILALVRELDAVVGFEVQLGLEGPLDTVVSHRILEHLLATIREALTNVGKHAHATRASVHVAADDGSCILTITDNGTGLAAASDATSGGGLGLPNLRRRAEKLHGTLTVGDAPGGGTVLTWTVPIAN